jgi:predicted TIM-barrel fold metal-dependent hydrolase
MMDDARWRSGYARLARLGLHFELQAPFSQLGGAARLARDFPDTTIVLNHTGLPSADDPKGWRAAMTGLAACSNVMVKISGMGVPVREFVLGALELFGVERAMFASNYPVDSLRASFTTIYSGFEEITHGMPEVERRALFHDNAVRIYRME